MAIVAIALVLAIVLLVIIASPGIQTALVNRYLPDEVAVRKFDLGFRGLVVSGISFRKDGALLSIESVEGDFSLLGTIVARHLHITDLVVSDLQIDLTNWKSADSMAPKEEAHSIAPREAEPNSAESTAPKANRLPWERLASFKGLFQDEIEWPPATIDRLTANVSIVLTGGGQRARIDLNGSDIRSGSDAKIRTVVNYSDASEKAIADRASLEGDMFLSISPQGFVEGLRADVLAQGELAAGDDREETEIRAALDLRRKQGAAGENLRLIVDLNPSDGEPLEIADIEAEYSYDSEVLAGNWSFSLDTRMFAPFFDAYLKGARGKSSAKGSFILNASDQKARLQGRGSLRAEQLDRFLADLNTVPSAALECSFDISAERNQIEIGALKVELAAPTETPLLQLDAQQPFGFDLVGMTPVYGDPTKPLALLSFRGLPVDLLNSFLPNMRIRLSTFSWEALLTGTGEDLHVESRSPLSIEGLWFSRNGESVIENIAAEMEPSLTYRTNSVSFAFGKVALKQAQSLILEMNTQGTVSGLDSEPRIDIGSEWNADLAQLLRQPAAKPYRNLSAGRLGGDLRIAGTSGNLKAECDLIMSDMVIASDRSRIKSLSLKADAAIEDMSKIEASLPISIEIADQTSRLRLDLDVRPEDERVRMKLKGRGENIYADHFQLVARAFQNPDHSASELAEGGATDEQGHEEVAEDGVQASPPGGSAPSAPEKVLAPVWNGMAGDVDLEIDHLILSDNFRLKDLLLRAVADKETVRVEKFNALLGASPVEADGMLSFRPGNLLKPYLLRAEFSLSDFDVGAYCREADPRSAPVIEGLVSLEGKLSSEAGDLEKLPDSITGDISIRGSDLTVRALKRGKTTDSFGAIGALTQLGGVLSGKQKVEAIGQVASYFEAVDFDRLEIDIVRKPDMSIDLNRLFLRNEGLLIEGRGKVSQQADLDLIDQQIRVTLDMAAHPPLALLLEQIDVLVEDKRDDGYRDFKRPVQIMGTVGKPDPSDMWKIFVDGAVRKLFDDEDQEGGKKNKIPIREIRDLFGI